MPEYNLHSKFDYKKHSETYVCYCEVVIMPNGTVYYAVPSHLEFLTNAYCTKYNITREELYNYFCSEEFLSLPYDFLLNKLHAVCVWYNFYEGKPNKKQQRVLNKLQDTGCCEFNNFKRFEL